MMNLIKVNMIGPESFETFFASKPDIFGRKVLCDFGGIVGIFSLTVKSSKSVF